MSLTDKNIEIYLDENLNLFIESENLFKGRRRYNDFGQVLISKLDETDLYDLFGFLRMRLMEKGHWTLIQSMYSPELLEHEKKIYKERQKSKQKQKGEI